MPLLAAGGGAGVVTIWDLEQRRLQTVTPLHFAYLCLTHLGFAVHIANAERQIESRGIATRQHLQT